MEDETIKSFCKRKGLPTDQFDTWLDTVVSDLEKELEKSLDEKVKGEPK